MSPPSSRSKNKSSKKLALSRQQDLLVVVKSCIFRDMKQRYASYVLHAVSLPGQFFDLEDGGDMTLQNVG
jgi:hypothetical protein